MGLSIYHLACHNVTIRKDVHRLKRILLARKRATVVCRNPVGAPHISALPDSHRAPL